MKLYLDFIYDFTLSVLKLNKSIFIVVCKKIEKALTFTKFHNKFATVDFNEIPVFNMNAYNHL